MHLSVPRETLLKPLQLVANITDKRPDKPILSNVLLVSEGKRLSLVGSDLEIELVGMMHLTEPLASGAMTLPARKLLDICRTLPESAVLEIREERDRVIVQSGRSRFVLSSQNAEDYPRVQDIKSQMTLTVTQNQLKSLLEKTYFAMAQQDVRYYLNGMLLQLHESILSVVATDGHRLAMGSCQLDVDPALTLSIIIPRKGIVELLKLLKEETIPVSIRVDQHHISLSGHDFIFSSKLVEGRFPDYRRVLPQDGGRILHVQRDLLKHAIIRASILANEKQRGIRFQLAENHLMISANNPEQEQAEEEVEAIYQGEPFYIGFNASYLLDVISAVSEASVRFVMIDNQSSVLIEADCESPQFRYVVMPLHI